MPTDISWTWWKKNAPASLPEDAVIKAKLKKIESTPVRDIIKAIQEAKGLDLPNVVREHVEPYHALIEQLKRYRSVVTKQKESHKDFVEAIDKLTDLAKATHKDLGSMLTVIQKQGAQAVRTETKVKKDLQTLVDRTDTMRVQTTAVRGKYDRVTDGAALETLIGNIRYMQQVSKKNVLAGTKLLEAIDAPEKATSDLLDQLKLTAKALMEESREIEKLLVRKAIALLGDKDGKALFLGATPVAPR
jgi:hypothetical protein